MDVSSSAADDGENEFAIGEDHENPAPFAKGFQVLVGCDHHRPRTEVGIGGGVDDAVSDRSHGELCVRLAA